MPALLLANACRALPVEPHQELLMAYEFHLERCDDVVRDIIVPLTPG